MSQCGGLGQGNPPAPHQRSGSSGQRQGPPHLQGQQGQRPGPSQQGSPGQRPGPSQQGSPGQRPGPPQQQGPPGQRPGPASPGRPNAPPSLQGPPSQQRPSSPGQQRSGLPGPQRTSSPAPPHSRSGSASGPPASGPSGYGEPLGYDPARDGPIRPQYQAMAHVADNKNLDLPPEAYLRNPLDITFPRRPAFNTESKAIAVEVNQFRVKTLPNAGTVYQYDINIYPDPKKFDAMCRKLWSTVTVQKVLQQRTNALWLYDGKKLAWAPVDIADLRIEVDLDNDGIPENQRKPPKMGRDGKPRVSVYSLIMRRTTSINLAVLPAYLNGQMGWSESLLEAMNFLDHLMRQYPSETQTRIKRNFFNSEARRMNLDLFVEVYKGTYASIRMNESIKRGGCGLGVNVDVANTAFWKEMPMIELVCRYLGWIDRRKWGNLKVEQLGRALRPVKTDKGTYGPSEAFTMLRKLHKLRFTVRHRNQKDKKAPKVYIINSFAFDNAYGADGGCASMVKFDWDGRKVTVAEYFREHYDCPLDFADLPVISTTRAGMFPLEICNVSPLERYQYKLDGEQTSKMIKFAVTRPTQRKQDIMDNQAKLCWDKDPYMKQFGLTIDDRMAKVEAKLIANPEIQFGNAKHNPGTTGRWDLRGKRFLTPNLHPLRSWAFVNTERAVNMRQVQEFANSFSKIYQGHGGKVAAPAMLLDFSNITNMAKAVSDARQKLMLANQSCQMLVFILGVVNSGQYERIKKSADCRFGIMTQCVLAAHVERNSGQYHSNLAMKINAKLGGATCRALPPRAGPNNPSLLPTSGPMTMMIGVDVSHAAPGSPVASMAAMTMSIDRETTRYAASCDTNGYRVEMLTEDNVKRLMGNLYTQWTAQGNGAPGHVYYFRDGVAESQYIHVLNQEVAPIRAWFKAKNITPKFTVVVATKRHHIRIFPAQGDRNQNPFPGTLVETEVTHPFQWDFYLCSHAAIQGTARPVHYTVIMDEAKCQPNQLQRLIYAQCYQYIRSTTPVSLHPAVYYAHLASNRARFHEHVSTQTGGHRSGGKAVEVQHDSLAKGAATGATVAGEARNTQSQRIMELGGSRDATQADRLFIQKTMWFI